MLIKKIDAKTMETYQLVVDLIKSGASPVEIGNAIRAGAGGDVASPILTALSHIETFVSLAKKSLPGVGGGLAAADLGNNVRKAINDIKKDGYVADNTLLSIASGLAGVVAVVAGSLEGSAAGNYLSLWDGGYVNGEAWRLAA